MLRTLLLAMALAAPALGVTPQGAFELADVCAVRVGVVYDGAVADPRSTSFELDKDNTAFEMTLEPGNDIKIEVGMVACVTVDPQLAGATEPPVCDTNSASHDPTLCTAWEDGGGLAFKGESGSFAITGDVNEGTVALNIIAVDQAVVYDPVVVADPASFNFPLIITSVAASPGTVKYGQTSTISVAALDISGKGINGYTVAPGSGVTLSSSHFSPANGGIACVGAATCDQLSFSAVAGDFSDRGNIPFQVTGFNSEDTASTIDGNLVIDPRGTVTIGLSVFNIPAITTTSTDLLADPAFEKELFVVASEGAQFSEVNLVVKDLDYVELFGQESLTPTVTFVEPPTPIDSRVPATHERYDCASISSFTFTQPSDGVTPEAHFMLVFDTSALAQVPGDFGVTACVAEIIFHDNSAAIDPAFSNAPSQKFTVTHIIYPPSSTFNAATDLLSRPIVRRTMISPVQAADDADVTVFVDFEPSDVGVGLEIALVPGATIADAEAAMSTLAATSATHHIGDGTTVIVQSNGALGPSDCTNGCPCDAGCRYSWTVKAGDFRNFYIYMKSSATGSVAVWEQVEIQPATGGRRRRRRAADADNGIADITTPFSTEIVDGKLKTELTPEFSSAMGEITPTTTQGPAGDEGAAEGSAGSEVAIIAGASGAAVALVALVALVLIKRANNRGKRTISPAPVAASDEWIMNSLMRTIRANAAVGETATEDLPTETLPQVVASHGDASWF